MHPLAQTNIQLFNQLMASGYLSEEMVLMHRCYETAMHLFRGMFRPSGKPFVAHLIGTASILAAQKASATVVAAGLLHAAYGFGRLRSGLRRAQSAKWLREVTHPDVESLVARYARLEWNERRLAAIHRSVESSPGPEREVVLIRLANELDDLLDLGARYCADAEKRCLFLQSSWGELVRIAQALEAPALARALELAARDTLAASVPEFLRGSKLGSFTPSRKRRRILPESFFARLIRSFEGR